MRDTPNPGGTQRPTPSADARRHDAGAVDLPRVLSVLLVVLVVAIVAFVFFGLRNRKYPVPDVRMMKSAEARHTIEAAGFLVGEETTQVTGNKAPDLVVGQAPAAGAAAKRKTPVDLTITALPQVAAMPDLVGMSGGEATSAMEELKIEPVIVQVLNGGVPMGEVFDQYPIPGADALQGKYGIAAVSSGRPGADAVTVPSVENTSMKSAVSALKGLGLVPVDYYTNLSQQDENGTVVRQIPAPGSQVDPGAKVVIVVSAKGN